MSDIRNIQTQTQTQTQTQVQTLSPQQVLKANLLALSTVELEERIRMELDDNPTLEESVAGALSDDSEKESDDIYSAGESNDQTDDSIADEYADNNEVQSDYGDDDGWYDYYPSTKGPAANIPVAESRSFYDILNEQLGERDLTEKQLEIARYIIGSIDNDGILDKDLQSISDDLAFYHNLDATVDEIEQVLLVIQDFDPAGIGARNLQECLLIQIRRKPDSPLKELQETIIATMFDEFTRKRQDKIAEKLRLDKKTMDEVMAELLKLNPRPGSALGETIGSSRQHIVPDFIVDCYNDDEISFTLNSSNIPTLRVNREYSDMLDNQIKSGKSNQRDAAIYLKRKLDAARGFIQALKQREQTLTSTMRAIIEKQRTFFLEGDESQLKPMVLKDIAEMTGYDISTISRSTSGKYVQTCFGTFPLKFFFTDGVRKKSGEKVSVKKIHSIIRDLIANEDQASPLTDEELASMLLERGFKIARRTVAKYREQIGIPVARLRKR